MTAVHIGDHELSPDQARDILRDYARRYDGTVLWYDLAGDEHGHPGPGGAAEPLNAVTLADIGRLVIINAGLRAEDVAQLLDAGLAKEFSAVSPAARLEECEPGGSLYSAATLLYDLFRLPGIGGVKRSKLLHLKRPWLIPIYDTHVHRIYKTWAADGGWWEAARRDLVDGAKDFAWLSASLSDDDDVLVRRAGKLTELRLLDILAWTLGSHL